MTTEQAAKLKGVGRGAVLEAIKRGAINAVKFGRHVWNVTDDEKFQAWQPAMTQRDKSARRWAKAKGRKEGRMP
jgi:excisionase family DNA binding protein